MRWNRFASEAERKERDLYRDYLLRTAKEYQLMFEILMDCAKDKREQSKIIKMGDVVRMKSGSPCMTVLGIENNIARLAFFDKNDAIKIAYISTKILIKVSD